MGQFMDARCIVSHIINFVSRIVILLSTSQNAGQNCIGIERLLVHVDQYDDLFAIFSERVEKMRVGSVMSKGQAGYIATVETGAMISGDRFRGLEKLIKDAEEVNAYVKGGAEYKHPYHEDGYYFKPTVLGPVDSSMAIANQECEWVLLYS